MGPIIFSTKFFELHTLWVFFAIAIITTTIILIKLSIKNSLKIQFISENAWKIILWGIIGARIMAIITNYNIYFYELSSQSLLHLLYIWDKGLDLWGAIIAITVYFYFLCKKSDQNFWKWIDVLVPAAILGLAIENIGLFFDGANYGTQTQLPWAVNFENPAVKYAVPIHPTQIYAFIYSLTIFIFLWLLRQTKKIKDMEQSGLIGLIGISGYSLLHFLEEFIRGDDTLMIFSIRIGQIGSFIAIAGTVTIIYRRYLRKNTSHLHSKQI